MQQYHELLFKILEDGHAKDDRTNTGTISLFGHQMRFDLQEGFPLVTTKKIFTRGVFEELLWFISGSTDVGVLQDKKVFFWDSWMREDGTIGDGYGHQMRNIEFLRPVVPRIYEVESFSYPTWELQEPSYHTDIKKDTQFLIGDYVDIPEHDDKVRILEKRINNNGRAEWVCQFQSNGYIKIFSYGSLKRKQGKNNFAPNTFGVGYIDEVDWKIYPNFLKDVWRDMLRRCYSKTHSGYKSYGGKGYHVCSRWFSLKNFCEDVVTIVGWENKLEYYDNFSLDKDTLYRSNRYDRESCMWANIKEQQVNGTQSTPFTAKSPKGDMVQFESIGSANKKYGLNVSAVYRCLNGKLHTHHGWSDFKYMSGHYTYRKIDQLKNVIATIKHNPDSRRHIISLWNAHDIDYMELPCCHGNMVQFYVSEGKLSCQMYQRSADVTLGVPFNIASYAALTHMIAQVCDLEVGDLVITLGDAHIYSNHIDQVTQLLQRQPRELPTLKLDKAIKSIDDFTINSFTIEGYNPHPTIKAPVAV